MMQLDWYVLRARLGTIYGLAELHQVSPGLAHLPAQERTARTLDLVDRLLEQDDGVAGRVRGIGQTVEWAAKSWLGMGRSLGL